MKKKLLVLSDNDSVAHMINLALRRELDVTQLIVNPLTMPDLPMRADGFDLIVVALSSYASEPIVALARASLVKLVGQVPLLIISDKPFEADPYTRIAHLDFPFALDQLNEQIDWILRGEFRVAGSTPRPCLSASKPL